MNIQEHFNVQCGCGVEAPLRTTLTNPNVGRRFLECVNYKILSDNTCKYFDWVDPPTCERGKDFGNWIVKKNMDLDKDVEDLRKQILHVKKTDTDLKGEIRVLKERENEFGQKMEQWQKRNAELRVKMEEVKAKNMSLRGGNKAMKENIELANLKVKCFTALVVILVGLGIV
ncbi:hypothetical protein RHMOL_Rhmol04G0179400 [Rhododendron molle]|uniref:Uncharacterized protein n=1 Tax=Rhododendron molle TaxID=49168 RepID=A0ACC0P390_RHOML|nr:hypothetical protein RHMOL_Rhmol04G0179400 [Rhododendron molle]